MKARARRDGTADERRKNRRRPTPKWILASEKLDAIARSRCLMVLSVLSGEKAVSDAIVDAKISRGTYYQMETRALNAMLAALNPLATQSESGAADLSAAARRIAELEAKLERLEQEKRRAERLLLMTRKTMRPAPVKTGLRGRPPKNVLLGSTPTGKSRSAGWKAKASATSASSTPTKDGESVP